MTKNRICATATGLPKLTRRSFVAGTAVVPFIAAMPARAESAFDTEVEIYARGYKDGQCEMVEAVRKTVEATNSAAKDDGAILDRLIAIRNHTGLSLDDLSHWFADVHPETLAQISDNIVTAPIQKWNKAATYAAVQGFMANEIFTNGSNPLAAYNERQIRLRGDRDEVKRTLHFFESSAEAYPALMDLA